MNEPGYGKQPSHDDFKVQTTLYTGFSRTEISGKFSVSEITTFQELAIS
jgi:hypothetical protein